MVIIGGTYQCMGFRGMWMGFEERWAFEGIWIGGRRKWKNEIK